MSTHPKRYLYNGAHLTLEEIGKLCGLSKRTIQQRLWGGEPLGVATLKRPRGRPATKSPGRKEKRYPYEGREVTLRELEAETGIAVKTLRTRLRMGWTIEEMASTPLDVQRSMASHGVHGRGWKWRTEWLRPKVLGYARTRDQTRYRDVDDLPLAYDPWAQAAIAQAERDGGWPLDLVGHVMGGITRERVRQIELMAMAKVRRAMGGRSKEEIVTMLRALEADRVVNTNSFELVESLEYGECQLKQKRKGAKP